MRTSALSTRHRGTVAALAVGFALLQGAVLTSSAHAGYLVFSKGSDLWLASDDGSGAKVLVTAASVNEVRLQKPSIQPGADKLAFESWNTDSQRVYAWENGTSLKVGNGWATGSIFGGAGASSNDPDMTSDGRVLFQSDAVVVTSGCDLYGCGVDGHATSGLVNVRFDGEDRRALPAQCTDAKEPAANPVNPAQFVYMGCWVSISGTTNYALRTAGGGTTDTMISYDDVFQHDPSWSPDGSQVLVSEEGDNPGIWVYGATPGSPFRRVLVPELGATAFQSPQFMGSDRIVFVKNGEIWAIPASCNACSFPASATQLTHLGGIKEVAWTSRGRNTRCTRRG